LLRRLLLECAERSKLTLGVDDLFHVGSTEGADQLVLQVCDAHVETEWLHVGASEVCAEAGPLETTLEVALLCGVTEARQSDVGPLRAEQIQVASDVLRTPHWHNGNALSVKIPTTALSQRFEREPVTTPFNKHDRNGFRHAAMPVSKGFFPPTSLPMTQTERPASSTSKRVKDRKFLNSTLCVLMSHSLQRPSEPPDYLFG
jgi:hypothetical protein